MNKLNQQGSSIVLVVSVIVLATLFLTASGFGIWAFLSRQDYKLNTDRKITAAVEVTKQKTSDEKDKEFAEKEKYPLREYKAAATFGSVSINYPKTWSAFITENTTNNSSPIDGYFHPSFVPGIQSGTAFALRVQISGQTYEQEMRQIEPKVKAGKVKVSPYTAPKVGGVAGARVDGEINPGQRGSMVLFPLRDKTVKIATQSEQFLGDFNTIILANLTFIP